MTIVRILVHTVLRSGVLGLLIAGYDSVYDQLGPPTPGDADIGKGLLAFLLIVVVCLAWGVVDGLRLPPVVWSVVWVATAVAVGLGWELLPLTGGSGGDVDPTGLAFTAQLVGAPALVAAAFAWLVGSRRDAA